MVATLLDFDGVVVDSEPVHLAAFNDVLVEFGVSIDADEYTDRYVSLDDAGVFRLALSGTGPSAPLSDDQVHALVAAKAPRFMARFEEAFRVFPGAERFIRRRGARGPVGIVSGALEREIVYALEKMGVRPMVSFIVSAERCVRSKPDPEPFLIARQELRRMDPRHEAGAVAVEDSTGGVRSARGAGLRCVAVTNTFPRERLLEAGAEAAVADLDELTDDLLDGGA